MNFNAEQAACISGCSQRQLRYWKNTGLIQPARVDSEEDASVKERYDFGNLIELTEIRGAYD